jgi:hypothetical protein
MNYHLIIYTNEQLNYQCIIKYLFNGNMTKFESINNKELIIFINLII